MKRVMVIRARKARNKSTNVGVTVGGDAVGPEPDTHPSLLDADDLYAKHPELTNPEAALRVLIEDGLAKRLGDLVGASQVAVRFQALRPSESLG